MGHDMDRAEQDRKARLAQQAGERFDAELRKHLKSMLDVPENRLVISRFMEAIAVVDVFSPNAMTQSRNIGRNEAVAWWIDSIRGVCPEKELPMRREYASALKSLSALEENY